MSAVAGVQHPVRGLFARYYIVQRMRDRLPEAPAGGAPSSAGDVNDSLSFLLSLLKDMNRLWVRMGAVSAPGAAGALVPAGVAAAAAVSENTLLPPAGDAASASAAAAAAAPPAAMSKGKKRRERERLELRVIVGAVLAKISALEALTLRLYSTVVLPALLSEIGGCADVAAQAFLVDSMLAVFPADWHTATLDTLLFGMRNLVPNPVRRRRRAAVGALPVTDLSPPPRFPVPVTAQETACTILLAIIAKAREGAAPPGEDSAPPPPPSVLLPRTKLPTPAGAAPGAVALASFECVLAHVTALGALSGGVFSGAGARAGGEGGEGVGFSAAAAPAAGAAGAGAAAAPPAPAASASATTSPASPASARLMALRHAASAAGASTGIASMLEIFSSLVVWARDEWGAPVAHVDAILGAAADYVRGVMGLPAGGGGARPGGGVGGGADSAAVVSARAAERRGARCAQTADALGASAPPSRGRHRSISARA
jgi:hypothetical protein